MVSSGETRSAHEKVSSGVVGPGQVRGQTSEVRMEQMLLFLPAVPSCHHTCVHTCAVTCVHTTHTQHTDVHTTHTCTHMHTCALTHTHVQSQMYT